MSHWFETSQNDHKVIPINNVIKIYRLHNLFHTYSNWNLTNETWADSANLQYFRSKNVLAIEFGYYYVFSFLTILCWIVILLPHLQISWSSFWLYLTAGEENEELFYSWKSLVVKSYYSIVNCSYFIQHGPRTCCCMFLSTPWSYLNLIHCTAEIAYYNHGIERYKRFWDWLL